MAALLLAPRGPVPAGLTAALTGLRRTAVMGILNVTPDSFSDGGRFVAADAARAHAVQMMADGADLIDVGGESTRPGAQRVSADEEADRVLPVVEALVDLGVPVSIDTMRAATAAAAVAAGATLVNDVSGGLADPDMLDTVAALRVPFILMHWRGHADQMADRPSYRDVVTEVADELQQRVAEAEAAGVARDRMIVDPGLGFAKDHAHNWALLGHLDRAVPGGMPVLVGASRKRFLGALLADQAGDPRPVANRAAASVAVTTLAAAAGAWCVRVHDVAPSADAVRVVAAWRDAADASKAVGNPEGGAR